MKTVALRWIQILALAVFGVLLGGTMSAAGYRGGQGGGSTFHSARGGPAPGFFRPQESGSSGMGFHSGDRGMTSHEQHVSTAGGHHGGGHYGRWSPAPRYWTPWSFGIGWDPYWWGWYPGTGIGYYSTAHSGEIKLQTDQKTAAVYINGGYAGTVKELKKFHLRPGAYDLEIRTSDGRVFQDHFYVLAGKTLKITPVFKPAGTPVQPEGS
jgi:hypothetical protein